MSNTYEEAVKYIPGGVNSPVRAFKSVRMAPVFIDHGKGSHVFDEDGNEYIDYISSWGPLILGHSNDVLNEGIEEIFRKGTSFGLPTKKEVQLARMMCEAYQGLDLVRMVNSGTEATMSAIRVARGYTKKDKIIKFEGNYHGHSDCLLVQAGSGALTFNEPTSPGVPVDFVKHTLVCRYNDIEDVKEKVYANRNEIACIIIEPVACNMGLVEADKEFMLALRQLCTEEGIVLIYDEVITGFRLGYGSAQEYFGIVPDMACFGKIIGAGLPVGAYGGKKEIMEMVSPSGPVYQAGTLSGNPLAMEMGIRQLTYLKDHPEVYVRIEDYAKRMAEGIRDVIEKYGFPCTVHQCKSLLTVFFKKGTIRCYDDVKDCDTEAFARFFRYVVTHGIMMAPSQYEGLFINNCHSENDLTKTLEVFEQGLVEAFR